MNNEVEIRVTADDRKAKETFKRVPAEASRSGETAGKGFSKKFEASTGKMSLSKKALIGIGAAIGTAATAAAGLFTKGFADNMHLEVANDKLAGQLDLTTAQADKAGKMAGQIYADNWGESIDDVNNALASVQTNIGNISNMAPEDLKKITEGALAISQAFDVDVNDSTRAAGKLMKNGLAKDSTDAFDMITWGLQHGLNASGDFLETLDEYAPQFAKLGFTGKIAIGAISQFLKAGARDTDSAADAFKEFSIRAIDGSTTTKDAYKSLGISGKKMGEQIAAGGEGAIRGLDDIIIKLQGVKDPVEQNRIGVELFGTQWEDTVRQILPKIDLAESSIEGVAGSTEDLANTIGDNAQGKIDGMKRGFEQWTQKMASTQGPLATTVTGVIDLGGGAFSAVTGLAQMAIAMQALNLSMLANPIVLVVAAVAALAVGLAVLWKKSQTAREIMSTTFSLLADAVIGTIKTIVLAVHGMADAWLNSIKIILEAVAKIPGPTQDAAKKASQSFNDFKDSVDGTFDGIEGKLDDYQKSVRDLPKKIKLEGDEKDLAAKLRTAQAQLKKLPKSKRTVVLTDIISAERNIARVRAKLRGIADRYVNVFVSEVQRDAAWASGHAYGGIIGAAAGGARGGLVQVGEHGRELVRLPYGSTVMNNGATENYLQNGGGEAGGGGRQVIEIRSGGSKLDDLLVEILRKSVRSKGGNVQLVLGKN